MLSPEINIFRSPIDLRCPIGGGIFGKGKAGSFAVGPLSAAQKEAVNNYTGIDYRSMNDIMRGAPTKHLDNDYKKELETSNRRLTSSIQASTTEKSAVVYRGVYHESMMHDVLASKVGQKITVPGFISTSKSESFARNWTTSDGTLMRIYVPKGAHALDAAKIHGGDHEQEVILPHNSKFTVHAVSKQGEKTVVDLIMHR